MPQTERWTLHTQLFDGPLDLLLYLVKREGIRLERLQVHAICTAYLDYLNQMQSLQLAIAADYLVMAATLVHLKSLSLLPRAPTTVEPEQDDPAQTLAEQLREYKRYKQASLQLSQRPWLGRDVFARQGEQPTTTDRSLITPIDALGLLDVYYGLLHRDPEPVHCLPAKGPDLGQCCASVVAWLQGLPGPAALSTLLKRFTTRSGRLVAFLAVLEMARLGWIDLWQTHPLGEVTLRQQPGSRLDLEQLTGQLVVATDDA